MIYNLNFTFFKEVGNIFLTSNKNVAQYLVQDIKSIKNVIIRHLSKYEAKILISEREQHYLDTLNLNYNVLKIAGSFLGHKYSEESKAKLS